MNMMKKFIILVIVMLPMAFVGCKAENADRSGAKDTTKAGSVTGTVVYLTNDSFKKLIFNYETNKEWKYEGNRPAIIDFYADWCAPCRQLSPIIDELAREYSGKVDIFKVDTEKERILAQNLGITSLPTLLFIPAEGIPQAAMGALPKESLIQVINEVLLIN